MNSIREKEVPALDDDFVKEASETANTVDEYKAEIREKLEKQAEQKADNAFESEILEAVVENTKIDLPEAMIEEQIDNMLRDMEMRLMYQGMRLDDYLKYTGQTTRSTCATPITTRPSDRVQHPADPGRDHARRRSIKAERSRHRRGNEVRCAEQGTASPWRTSRPGHDREGDKKYFEEVASLTKTIKFLKDNAGKAE